VPKIYVTKQLMKNYVDSNPGTILFLCILCLINVKSVEMEKDQIYLSLPLCTRENTGM
jgi:hypothetical protein